MAERKIIWTNKANFERIEILNYWINRNKSKTYSIKLNRLFIEYLKLVAKSPDIGKPTDIENTRVIIIRDYLLFYEEVDNKIIVLTLWDSRRNPENIKLK